jgi:hypothetical protein
MHSREVDFLRRLIVDRPQSRRRTGLAQSVADLEGVGTIRGAAVYYDERDFARAANILQTRGYPLTVPAGEFSRSEAPAGGSEKTGSLPVSNDMVAVVPMGMAHCTVPRGGFLALPADIAIALSYDVLLVCENMEPLLRLHTYGWLSTYSQARPTLAVFRGAPGFFRTDVVAQFMLRDTRPTLAFFDFDPMGLFMAASLPRLEAVCLPDFDSLENATRRNHRAHLFTNSYADCRSFLNSVTKPDISAAWKLLQRLQLGLDQEHFPRC